MVNKIYLEYTYIPTYLSDSSDRSDRSDSGDSSDSSDSSDKKNALEKIFFFHIKNFEFLFNKKKHWQTKIFSP